ncbi:fimbrial protein [Vibrio rumoiensis]|uniref:Fimbrial protein n=1 Tax=Vibrio rumoiensis TaxID=76258 RepID=A0ABW7IVD0_9VIBR
MIKLLTNRIINVFFLFLSAFIGTVQAASCDYADESMQGPSSYTLRMENVNTAIDSDSNVLDVLATTSFHMSNYPIPPFFCGTVGQSGNVTATVNASGSNQLTGYKVIYPTNIAGIGIRFWVGVDSDNSNHPPLPLSMTEVPMSYNVVTPPGTKLSFERAVIKVALVKTGPITQGGNLVFTRNNFLFAGAGTNTLNLLNLTVTAKVQIGTCSIAKSSPSSVELGSASINDFPYLGATSSPTPVNIQLDCSGDPQVYFYLDSSNQNTVIRGDGLLKIEKTANSASGVGIQITHQNIPIKFDRNLLIGRPPSNGSFIIPLEARYLYVGGGEPGRVRSHMTFTISYR